MKAKILIAAAIAIGSSAVTAQAQVKRATSQLKTQTNVAATTNAKAEFLNKVQAFEQEKSADKANDLLQQLKESMMEGLTNSKAQVAQSGEAGDKAGADQAMELNSKRSEIYNQLIRASRNTDAGKGAVVTILKNYAETL